MVGQNLLYDAAIGRYNIMMAIWIRPMDKDRCSRLSQV